MIPALQTVLPRHWRLITYGTMGKRPLRYYVYAWYDSGTLFYIGCGKELRAWAEHRGPSQERRLASLKFRVSILHQNLSKKQAHFIERQLIVKHQPIDNIRIPR